RVKHLLQQGHQNTVRHLCKEHVLDQLHKEKEAQEAAIDSHQRNILQSMQRNLNTIDLREPMEQVQETLFAWRPAELCAEQENHVARDADQEGKEGVHHLSRGFDREAKARHDQIREHLARNFDQEAKTRHDKLLNDFKNAPGLSFLDHVFDPLVDSMPGTIKDLLANNPAAVRTINYLFDAENWLVNISQNGLNHLKSKIKDLAGEKILNAVELIIFARVATAIGMLSNPSHVESIVGHVGNRAV
ncbi:MAG: hypothetical protein AAGI90_00715, partial [Chlamydiota bacterium]